MSVALGIMAIEWALFLLLAWYLEQVLPSGKTVSKTISKPSDKLRQVPYVEALAVLLLSARDA